MSGTEPIVATAAAEGTAALTAAEAVAAAEAIAAAEAFAASEAAASAAAAETASTLTAQQLAALEAAQAYSAGESAIGAMEGASTASQATSALNPYVATSVDKATLVAGDPTKAALYSNAGYGPGMSGMQTSVFDTTLALTGSPQLSAMLAGSGVPNKMLANVGTNMAMSAMKPRQQTNVQTQLRQGRPVAMNQVAGLLEQQRRKRRPISLL
jgi:hypothetical protein